MISQKLQSSKILIIGLVLALATILVTALPTPAYAQAKDAVCAGLGSGDCSDTSGESTLDGTIGSVIDILSIIVAVIAVIMIIIGGFRYVTSGGDSNSVSGAKNTIIYALVGLIIVAVAQVLVRFTVNNAISDSSSSSPSSSTPAPSKNVPN